MIRKWFSRYSFNYARSLVYMLQVSEYDIRDFLYWYHRTRDFTQIEKRKKLVLTAKSILLLATSWVIILLMFAIVIYFIFIKQSVHGYVLVLASIIFGPYVLPYVLVFSSVIINNIIQKPLQSYIINQAEKRLASHPGVKVGIAGSFGKTTMREILKTVLSEGKKVSAPPHSYNTPLGISRFIKTLSGQEEVLLFELGEYYPGDIKKLCDLVKPSIGIITGINEAHLHKFKTLDKTVGTIFELADFVGRGTIYANADSPLVKENIRPGHILYGKSGVGNYRVEQAKTSLAGTSFTLVIKDRKIELISKLLGLHQVGPLAMAVSLAIDLGLSIEQIKAGVEKTKPFSHRLEPKFDTTGVVVLDDSYNGNPDGVMAVIDFLGSLRDHRRFYLTPGLVEMGSKTEQVHFQIGKQLAKAEIEKVILIKNSVTTFIADGLQAGGYAGDVIWFADSPSAFNALPVLTISGDVVLIQNDWPDQYQ
jgi:UDP-N-acetylmuramoyl-tripeptide--D-alanyl-D-alanine ligase